MSNILKNKSRWFFIFFTLFIFIQSSYGAKAMLLTRDGNDNDRTKIYTFDINIDTDNVTNFRYVTTVSGRFRSLVYYDGKFITAKAWGSGRGQLYSISLSGSMTRVSSYGDLTGDLGDGNVESLAFDENGNRLFTQGWHGDGHISRNRAGNYIYTNTSPNVNYAMAYHGNSKYTMSFESNGVKNLDLSSGARLSDVTGDGGISCTYGGESVSDNKSYFVVSKGSQSEKNLYVVNGSRWSSTGFNYGNQTGNSKAEALAIEHGASPTPPPPPPTPPGKPFACDDNAPAYFFTSSATDRPTTSYGIDLLTGDHSLKKSNFHRYNINAIGFNVKDNYIWGWDRIDKKVTRVDGDYKTRTYNVSGLPSSDYRAGDVSPDGILYFIGEHEFVKVNLNGASPTYGGKVSFRFSSSFSTYYKLADGNYYHRDVVLNRGSNDFAFSPIDGKMYTLFYANRHLLRINPSNGYIEDLGYTGVTSNEYHTFVFDADGNLYFYGTRKNVFKINTTVSPRATLFSTLSYTACIGDGTRCPNSRVIPPIVAELSINDVSIDEGNSGTKNLTFTVTSDHPAPSGGISVNYATQDGTAKTSDNDYISKSGTVNIPEGSTSTTITIQIKGDNVQETNEVFYVNLSNPSNASIDDSQGRGTIQNDDALRFDAWEIKPYIKTKLAKQDVVLTVASLDNNGNSVVNSATNIQVALKSGGTILTSWVNVSFSATDTSKTVNFGNVSNVYKNVKAVIRYKDINGVIEEDYSTDSFAIRPKEYKIDITPASLKAGESFHIIITAIDGAGHTMTNYNGGSDTYELTYDDAIHSCLDTLTFAKVNFSNGVADITAKYKNVGELNFTVVEKDANGEYAHEDEGDGSGNSRFIEEGNKANVIVKPYDIKLAWSLTDGSNINNMTYYDKDLTTAARLKITMSAIDADTDDLTNFKPSCYAEDMAIVVSYNTQGEGTSIQTLKGLKIDGDESGDTINIYTGLPNNTSSFLFNVPRGNFTTPEITRNIDINYDRDQTIAVEPIHLTVSAIGATTSVTGTSGSLSKVGEDTNFYYTRAYAPDQSVVGDTLNALVTYEVYCKYCTHANFAAINSNNTSLSSPYWYRISSTGDTLLSFSNVNIVNTGAGVIGTPTNNNITIKADQVPHNNKVRYKPTPYLRYNRFNNTIQTHSFNIDFTSIAKQWSGKGEQGSVVDTNISQKSNMSLDW